MMTSFEFVTVLVSVITGLAVTHLLTGLGRAIHLRSQASLWWVALCWTASVFIYLALHWWQLFYMSDKSVWNFWVFLYILFHSVLLFLLAVLLYRPDPDGALNLRFTFETNRSWFFGVLAAAFGEDRQRFQSAAEVQRYSGIAPVTERSGNTSWVHWRWACPNFVRQTFVEWAEKTVHHSFWAGVYYRQQRSKGASHYTAVRALAFKGIRILYRCWQSRAPYDESLYLKALQRRSSNLVPQDSA